MDMRIKYGMDQPKPDNEAIEERCKQLHQELFVRLVKEFQAKDWDCGDVMCLLTALFEITLRSVPYELKLKWGHQFVHRLAEVQAEVMFEATREASLRKRSN